MILHAHMETVPAASSGTHEPAVREVQVEAATYEEGAAALRAQLTDGERLITIRTATH